MRQVSLILILSIIASSSQHETRGTQHQTRGTQHQTRDPYYMRRVATVSGLTSVENEQIEKCILSLDRIPANCQIYMADLMVKFLPVMYYPDKKFNLYEVLSWSLDRYDSLMTLCEDNCYNYTISYSKNCMKDMPISNFFKNMTTQEFRWMLMDLSALLCYTNPGGDSCMKHEAELITGRAVLDHTLLDRCFVQDRETNQTILPATCLPQCRLFLVRIKGEYGCCLNSWRIMSKYSEYFAKIISLYPEQLFSLLNYCAIETPGQCPVLPDTSKISTGLIAFLGIVSSFGLVALIMGIVKNFREDHY